MNVFTFFESHAGKSVLCICAAGLLLGWPPALPWITAVALLKFGVRHMALAFEEVEREPSANTQVVADAQSLPPPDDGERRLPGARGGAVPDRSPLD